MRSIAMNCFIRILWIYLNRCPESSTSTRKRLDTLLRVCFPANGSLYPPELALEPFVAIIHYISARQLDYGLDEKGAQSCRLLIGHVPLSEQPFIPFTRSSWSGQHRGLK